MFKKFKEKLKKSKNSTNLFIGFIILILGLILIIINLFIHEKCTDLGNTLSNIGYSLLATGIASLVQFHFTSNEKANPLDEWKVENIFAERASINLETDKIIRNKCKNVDVIAFGLKSFRESQIGKDLGPLLKKGLKIRIVTMDPNSSYVEQRALEENSSKDEIKNSINTLVKWGQNYNEELRSSSIKKSIKGGIFIKSYTCMSLDFFWKVKNVVYIGPYPLGKGSQQTITYKFKEGGTGFEYYTKYFEELWEGKLCPLKTLVNTSK